MTGMTSSLFGFGTSAMLFLALLLQPFISKKINRPMEEVVAEKVRQETESVAVKNAKELVEIHWLAVEKAYRVIERLQAENDKLESDRDRMVAWATAQRNAIEIHLVAERARQDKLLPCIVKCEQIGVLEDGAVSLGPLPSLYVPFPQPALEA